MIKRVAINQILAVARALATNQLETDKTAVAMIGETTMTTIGVVTGTMTIEVPNVTRRCMENNRMVIIMAILDLTSTMGIIMRVIGRPGELGKNTRGDIHTGMIMGDITRGTAIFSSGFVTHVAVPAFTS